MKTVIYCGHSFEEFSPKSEEEGRGGSEEAVINMARELVKLGNEVTVYNRCGDDEGEYDGVKYENYEYFDDITADVVVFWRQPNYIWDLRDKYKAKQTYLWLHDTVPESELLKIKHFVDGVFVLSGFHASLYPNMRDKLIRTANGIKFEDTKVKRDPYKIVYGSSYDRGLKELLEMWPEIKAYEKEATLTVFYGMSMIQDENFKDEIKHLLNQEGITELGRISHKEVAEQFASAGVWCYPCVTGDTLIDMPRDYSKYPQGIPIRELVGKKDFPVWSYNTKESKFELKLAKKVWKTKENAELIRIDWDNGISLRLTPEHKVLTYARGWVEAKDLKINESVVALKKHMEIQVSTGESKWETEHRHIARWKYGEIPKGHHIDHIDGNCFNNTPENLQILSPQEHGKKTFTGLKRSKKAKEITTQAWRDKYWDKLDDTDKSNMMSQKSKTFWDRMTPAERAEFTTKRAKKVKAGQDKYLESLTKEERSKIGAGGRITRWNHKVLRIEKCGREDVYDMSVEGNHSFVANGVVVHNCWFPEISCITAMKAQAYGAIPVITPTAALQETVRWGLTTREPRDHNGEMPWGTEMPTRLMDRYVNITKKALDPDYQYRFRQMMMSDARRFTWERVALSWDKLWKFGRSLKK
jgi:hypothetical protein